MRIDFNQFGSWRKGIDFGDVNESYVMELAGQLAECGEAKARIMAGNQVTWYFDPGLGWRRAGTGKAKR